MMIRVFDGNDLIFNYEALAVPEVGAKMFSACKGMYQVIDVCYYLSNYGDELEWVDVMVKKIEK